VVCEESTLDGQQGNNLGDRPVNVG